MVATISMRSARRKQSLADVQNNFMQPFGIETELLKLKFRVSVTFLMSYNRPLLGINTKAGLKNIFLQLVGTWYIFKEK